MTQKCHYLFAPALSFPPLTALHETVIWCFSTNVNSFSDLCLLCLLLLTNISLFLFCPLRADPQPVGQAGGKAPADLPSDEGFVLRTLVTSPEVAPFPFSFSPAWYRTPPHLWCQAHIMSQYCNPTVICNPSLTLYHPRGGLHIWQNVLSNVYYLCFP